MRSPHTVVRQAKVHLYEGRQQLVSWLLDTTTARGCVQGWAASPVRSRELQRLTMYLCGPPPRIQKAHVLGVSLSSRN